MTDRTKTIEKRAAQIFERANTDPYVSWNLPTGARPGQSSPTRAAPGESERKRCRDQAERELIDEGVIQPV